MEKPRLFRIAYQTLPIWLQLWFSSCCDSSTLALQLHCRLACRLLNTQRCPRSGAFVLSMAIVLDLQNCSCPLPDSEHQDKPNSSRMSSRTASFKVHPYSLPRCTLPFFFFCADSIFSPVILCPFYLCICLLSVCRKETVSHYFHTSSIEQRYIKREVVKAGFFFLNEWMISVIPLFWFELAFHSSVF